MTDDVRTRVREAMRAELAEQVLAVFLDRGYDDVTVDDAAAAVGISRATFFRYFGSKEDAVVDAAEATRVDYAAALRAVPAGRHSTWELLRLAVEPTVVATDDDRDRHRRRLRLIASKPALRARLTMNRDRAVRELGDALGERLGDPFAGRVAAAAALAALSAAWQRWVEDDDATFRSVVDDAFARLAAAGEPRAL